MRDVETELLGQKERSVVKQSSFKRRNTLHRSKPHVHFHLVRAIVDVVGMEQRIQRRTTIHEVAIAETQISITPPCRCRMDSAMHSTCSEPTRLEESFSTMITVPLLLTWDPLVSIRNSPLSTRFNSSLFLGAFLHLVLRMVLNNTQFITHSL